MSMMCKACSHPDRKLIDASIANREPILRIAERFGLNDSSLGAHAKAHVLPMLESLELQANAAILKSVQVYRDEVNYPLFEKSKHIENKLWDDYYAVNKPAERMLIMRELTKQQIEQAKLTGAYLKEQENPQTTDAIANKMAAKLVKDGHFTQLEDAKQWLANVENDVSIEGIIG